MWGGGEGEGEEEELPGPIQQLEMRGTYVYTEERSTVHLKLLILLGCQLSVSIEVSRHVQ